MIIIKEYVSDSGRSPFGKWFDGLDNTQAMRVKDALDKLANGKSVAAKSLKDGLHELKIKNGGLRIYYAQDGAEIILLLGGGQKDNQSKDIENARNRLAHYQAREVNGDG